MPGHKKYNYKYCYKKEKCAVGKEVCYGSQWTDKYKTLPNQWPPLNDENCPVDFPYRTKIPEHKKYNYKYCYKKKDCALGKKVCYGTEWTDKYKKLIIKNSNIVPGFEYEPKSGCGSNQNNLTSMNENTTNLLLN